MNSSILRRLPSHLSTYAKQPALYPKPRLIPSTFRQQQPSTLSRPSRPFLTSRRHNHSQSSSPSSQPQNTQQTTQPQEQPQEQSSPQPHQRSPLLNSTTPRSTALPHKPAPHRDPNEPIYQLTFTCKPCQHRSSHTISKQGYHHGTVLITCPGCKNRHLIADHLHIFSDERITLEDIMRQHGESVQRGSITPEGDVEFWAEDAQALEDVQAKAAKAAAMARQAQLGSGGGKS